MDTAIQAGDVVKLRGSTVTMTVNKLYDDDNARCFAECLWFIQDVCDTYSALNRDHFAVAALEKA